MLEAVCSSPVVVEFAVAVAAQFVATAIVATVCWAIAAVRRRWWSRRGR